MHWVCFRPELNCRHIGTINFPGHRQKHTGNIFINKIMAPNVEEQNNFSF